MKKGFTLIELLAVILILGIIALIAIPTVNNILKEARENAFKASANNIMKVIEEKCQTSSIKDESPVLLYLFENGNINHSIEAKGTFPNDGYVLLDNECTVTKYYLKNKNSVHSNGEDIREDFMLKASTDAISIFKSLYSGYYDNIINVNFVNHLNIPAEAIEIKDPSVSENSKIKSWLIPNEENFDLYVGSENEIYTNYDSSYLFADMKNTLNINIPNLNTSFTKNMDSLFYNCRNITNLDLSKWNTANVTNMQNIFYNCFKVENINLRNFNTNNVENDGLIHIFHNCYNLKSLDLSKWSTKKITTFTSIFNNCTSLSYLNISTWDTSNVQTMYAMFSDLRSLNYLDVSHFNTKNVIDMSFMFDGLEFGSGLTEIKGLENFDLSSLKWTGAMFAGTNKIKEIKFSNASKSMLLNISTTWGGEPVSMFVGCESLTYLDLGNLDISKTTSLSTLFKNVPNLNKIKYNNSVGIERILEYIPTKAENNKGTFIVENKSNIASQQINILNSKHWDVI